MTAHCFRCKEPTPIVTNLCDACDEALRQLDLDAQLDRMEMAELAAEKEQG